MRTALDGHGHRVRDEHEAAPVLDSHGGASDTNDPFFEGLTEGIEHGRLELAELVQEEHAAMREGD